MAEGLMVDIFAEDRAHEEFICALVRRLAAEKNRKTVITVRAARGGHGRVTAELKLYQLAAQRGLSRLPDVLVVAVDANCKRFAAARADLIGAMEAGFQAVAAIACPDPHVERWYLADPESFARVVGVEPKPGRRKCERDRYKSLLAQAVREGGHVPALGGIEFAEELVNAMDLFRASRHERSLKAFLDELEGRLG